jgi:hypothetical protein
MPGPVCMIQLTLRPPLYSEVGDDLGGHDGDISSVLEARGRNRVSTPRDSLSGAEVEDDGSPFSPALGQQGGGDGAPPPLASGGNDLGGHESLAGKRSAPGSPTGTSTLDLLFYSCILNKSLVFSSRRWQGGVPARFSSNTRPIPEHGCCTAVRAQALQEC